MLTVSDTAYAIATVRAMEAELADSERLFADPYGQIFAAAGAHAREGTERFLSLPFLRNGVRLRTRFIDDVVGEAIAQGARQLVLMGAGFDARALRLAAVARHEVRTFEVDLPALLATKRSLLERAGIAVAQSIHYVACDFNDDFAVPLVEALLAAGFDRARPTVFVWEGVTAYIDRGAVDRCLRFMASISAPGSRVVFDYSEYVFDREQAQGLVRRAGFSSFEEVSSDELWRRHLPGEPHPAAYIAKLGIATR